MVDAVQSHIVHSHSNCHNAKLSENLINNAAIFCNPSSLLMFQLHLKWCGRFKIAGEQVWNLIAAGKFVHKGERGNCIKLELGKVTQNTKFRNFWIWDSKYLILLLLLFYELHSHIIYCNLCNTQGWPESSKGIQCIKWSKAQSSESQRGKEAGAVSRRK